MRSLSFLITIFLIVFIVTPVMAAGTDAVHVTGIARTSGVVHLTQNDVYAFGDQITNTGNIAGHMMAAGRLVELNGEVAGDFMAAGREIKLEGTVLDDARIVGINVNISGNVTDAVYAVGQQVFITDQAIIGGDVTLNGQNIMSTGLIQGNFTANGTEVVLGGDIGGRVTVHANQLTLLPGVKIKDGLYYTGSQPLVLPPVVTIKGGIFESQTPFVPQFDPNRITRWLMAAKVVWQVSLLVVGLLWLWMVPRTLLTATSLVGGWFGISIITGLIALVIVPPLAALLMATILGIPLGFILLCMYGIMLYLSFIPVALWLGRKLVRSEKRDVWAMILGCIVLSLLMHIPWAGPLFGLLVLTMGLGALVRTQFRVMRYMREVGVIG
jgi:hypothetical protein